MKLVYTLIASFAVIAAPAFADAPDCKVRIVQMITDDIGNTWQPGRVLPVDIQREDTKGTAFCAHGGSCIPRLTGTSVAARLVNCRKGKSLGHGDYGLVHLRRTTRVQPRRL